MGKVFWSSLTPQKIYVWDGKFCQIHLYTLPETAPENGWLEYYFPIAEAYFQGLR